jgi:hypothetical protein
VTDEKKVEVAGKERKLYTEELHNVYASSNIIMVKKSKRLRWTGHIAHMRDMTNVPYTKFQSEYLEMSE